MSYNRIASLLLAGLAVMTASLIPAGSPRAENGRIYAPWIEQAAAPAAAPDKSAHDDLKPARLTLDDVAGFLDSGAGPSFTMAAKPSPIETLYAERIVDELPQFGYELFDHDPAPEQPPVPAGKVPDSYRLGSGDSLSLTLRGQESTRQTVTIDRQGMLVSERFMPLAAAGKTLAELRRELSAQAAQSYNTDLYVSLDGVRQIGVLVIGDVRKPGLKTLTPFHTVLGALNGAGGINKTGSLRMVKLVRGGTTRFIDLYSVMMQGGGGADLLLEDGDRLIVPPLGPTVAVAGDVKRPGIYEIKRGQKLSLHEMLGMAGGVLIPADNRFMRLAALPSGDERVEPVADAAKRLFGDGDILQIARSEARRARDIILSGETRRPGNHPHARAKKLSQLLDNPRALGEDIYPLIGVIERRDAQTLTRRYIEFSPQGVIRQQSDAELEEGDRVHLFSMPDIVALGAQDDAVAGANELLTPISFTPDRQAIAADKRVLTDALLVSFLKERSASVRGAVRRAGPYPVADGTMLEDMLAAAGGPTVEADTGNVEITKRIGGASRRTHVALNGGKAHSVEIGPGDTVRVNQAYRRVADESVTLLGEVAHPGKYDLMPGDTLSTLLRRAGGLSEQAYPPGTIFSRRSERTSEEARYRAQAQDLEMKLAAALGQQDSDKKPDMTQIGAAQGLVAQLKTAQAVGRITVEADPGMLMREPEQDILLEGGDRIYIPKRPLTVRVAGEVLSSASLQFRKGKTARDYINEAGGTTYYADTDRAFVIAPDGSAKPLSVSSWNHSPTFIMPGSTIIVPRDPKPYNFLEGAERISQILANLAISGLYIDALKDD